MSENAKDSLVSNEWPCSPRSGTKANELQSHRGHIGTQDHFIFDAFCFRELTSTFVKLKSLVQRAKETLEENIIDLYKEITRLEKIENDAKILR